MNVCFRMALAGCLLAAPSLLAQNLKGAFPFNETITIVQQAATGGSCGTSLSGPVSTSFINDSGTWTFDGKGGMSIADHGIMVSSFPPTDASQVVGEAAQCVGTYKFLDTKTVDLKYRCSLDNWVSYFAVHSYGRITPTNLLVHVVNNEDGTPGVTPYVYQGTPLLFWGGSGACFPTLSAMKLR